MLDLAEPGPAEPGVRARLFCLPFAGGGSSIYRRWPGNIAGLSICPVQLPGREDRFGEPPHRTMGPLVDELAQVIGAYAPVPFAIFGHSMGAQVGHALTFELERAGMPSPVHLFAAAAQPPHWAPTSAPAPGEMRSEMIARHRAELGERRAAELAELLLPTLMADREICTAYPHAPPRMVGAPITAIGGSQDSWVTAQEVAAWRDCTLGDFRLRMLDCDHFSMLDRFGDIAPVIAEALGWCDG